ncbi:hypothetical protein JJB11_13205 [Ramlibacter ginsenosidimutans]|uniref:DUF3466 family protein n=1 Tax=Ramlibacter ginsenosidimutans TaxID=502333 RepID=A0A934WN12_9BURK|nr:hypothetical protein [Ramlibacter ginsenosidimutans]MBK6007053.1 hypothetical protein [Ramlibacter ginsenosidimutans]
MPTRTLAATLPLLASLLLAACGGGGTSNDVAAPAPAPAPAATPAVAPSPAPAAEDAPPWTVAATNSTSRAIAVLASGERAAAWSDAGGTIWSQRFDAQGKRVGNPLAIGTGTAVAGIAALPAGGAVVEFGTASAVYVQVVSAAGALVGSPATVRTQPQVESDLAGNIGPKLLGGAGVFALADGGFAASYVRYHDAHIPGDTPTDLMAQKFDATGAATGTPVFLASSRDTSTLAIAPTAGHGVAVADMYLCPCAISGSTSGDVFDGSLQSTHANLSNGGARPGDIEMDQSVAALAGGNVFVKWTVTTAAPATHSQVNEVQGEIFGSASTGILTFPNAAPDAQATALAAGGFVLTWGSSAQAFDATGHAVTGVMPVLQGSVAATPDGGFIVLAQVGDRLVAQPYALGP